MTVVTGSEVTASEVDTEPFFVRDGERYLPQPICAGPWDPTSLHGRVVAGLLAYELEREYGAAGFVPARLTVDMYRLPGFAPVTLVSRSVREGRRIKVVDAEFYSDGKSMGRATCQFLRTTASPPGQFFTPATWDAPAPASVPVDENGFAMWETRRIAGDMSSLGPRQMWMREVRELVAGEALTPWQRVALAADFASPFANASDQGLGYINSDITLYLHRVPTTPFVGFDVVYHGADAGVAVGECRLYDEAGPIGSSTVTALVNAKPL